MTTLGQTSRTLLCGISLIFIMNVLYFYRNAQFSLSQREFRRENICPVEPSSGITLKKDYSPLFNLRSDKFLIPILAFGPMNQINGIFETIALSIILNRTFIIPKLYRHYQDYRKNNGSWSIDPAFRISISKLNKLLPTVYSDEITRICPNGPEAIFPTKEFSNFSQPLKNYVHNFERYLTEKGNWTVFKYSNGVYNMREKAKYDKETKIDEKIELNHREGKWVVAE